MATPDADGSADNDKNDEDDHDDTDFINDIDEAADPSDSTRCRNATRQDSIPHHDITTTTGQRTMGDIFMPKVHGSALASHLVRSHCSLYGYHDGVVVLRR
jgi:hypothetical protein